jgi:hypothetical protein
LTGCKTTFQGSNGTVEPVPCVSYSSASSHWVADSGRLILRNDGTADWMLGTTRTTNPCYLSGAACSTTTAGVDRSSATYRIGKDSVVVRLAHAGSSGADSLVLIGPVPDQVTSRWAGPDVLTFNLSNGAYLGVLTH